MTMNPAGMAMEEVAVMSAVGMTVGMAGVGMTTMGMTTVSMTTVSMATVSMTLRQCRRVGRGHHQT